MLKRVVLVMFTALSAGCSDTNQLSVEVAPRPIAWFHPKPAQPWEQRDFTGVTRVAKRAELSFEVPGKVETVEVEIGQMVTQGQLLAKLDATQAQLLLSQRKSELLEAKAMLVEAKQAHERIVALRKKGVVGQADLDQAIATLESAASRVEVTQSLVAQAEKSLADTELRAPYDGVIAGRWIEASQQVMAQTKVFTIHGKQSDVEVNINVPESVVSHLSVGSEHAIEFVDSSMPQVTATLTELSGLPDVSGSYLVRLRFSNPGYYVRDGLTATAHLTYQTDNNQDSSGWHLPTGSYVVAADNWVKVYRYQESSQTVNALALDFVKLTETGIIASGSLSEDDYLVEKGVNFLSDGQQVSLLEHQTRRFNP